MPDQPAAQQGQGGESRMAVILRQVSNFMILYFVVQFVTGMIWPKNQDAATGKSTTKDSSISSALDAAVAADASGAPPPKAVSSQPLRNAWPDRTPARVEIFLSTSEDQPTIADRRQAKNVKSTNAKKSPKSTTTAEEPDKKKKENEVVKGSIIDGTSNAAVQEAAGADSTDKNGDATAVVTADEILIFVAGHNFVYTSDFEGLDTKVQLPEDEMRRCIVRNCTLFVHSFMASRASSSPYSFQPPMVHRSWPFSKFHTVFAKKTRRLMGGADSLEGGAEEEDEDAKLRSLVNELPSSSSSSSPVKDAYINTQASGGEYASTEKAASEYKSSSDSSSGDSDPKAVATTGGADDKKDDEEEKAYRVFMLIPPEINMSPVTEFGQVTPSSLPPTLQKYVFEYGKNGYYPILFFNNFWVLQEHFLNVNETTIKPAAGKVVSLESLPSSTEPSSDSAKESEKKENGEGDDEVKKSGSVSPLEITVRVQPTSMIKFAMLVQFDYSFDMQESWGVSMGGEKDRMKKIFLDNNPWFLALTFFISALHMVFEYLAFSNDVSFWRKKKNAGDFRGFALRTVALNCYYQLVIFLYLFDSETSYAIVLPAGAGMLIEFWKLTKCVHVEKDATAKFGYKLKWNNDTEKDKTTSYDQQAMKYLFWLGVPCLIAYSAYSLHTDEYKSWYSFIIKCQVRFIYFSGFVMLTPQIFINYKMKSVPMLPWKSFVYKALNTVIDDFFAFIITMPTMHRLACFRDDIVFAILLYQRWCYPVDNSRVNEFGQGGEEDEENKKDENGNAIESNGDGAKAIEGEAKPVPSEGEEKEKPVDVALVKRKGKKE